MNIGPIGIGSVVLEKEMLREIRATKTISTEQRFSVNFGPEQLKLRFIFIKHRLIFFIFDI